MSDAPDQDAMARRLIAIYKDPARGLDADIRLMEYFYDRGSGNYSPERHALYIRARKLLAEGGE
jgi:hypothetical protein